MSHLRSREKKPIKYQEAQILSLKTLSKTVKLFTLQSEEPFSWIPGQFIITKNFIEGEERIADYTIITTNNMMNSFEIIVENYLGSRVGKFLHSLSIGDKLIFKGPRGRFYLEENSTDIDFVFRNIGIAAAIPLLQELYNKNYSKKIRIFNVLTSNFAEILRDRIEQFSEKLRISYQIIDKHQIEEVKLDNGKFLKNDIDKIFGSFYDTTIYISGSSEFNKAFRQKIINFGASKDKIFREMFG